MTSATIEVLVAPDGSIKIEAVGFQGADCERATAFLGKALGEKKRTEKKPEYYQRTTNSRKQALGNQ